METTMTTSPDRLVVVVVVVVDVVATPNDDGDVLVRRPNINQFDYCRGM
jgi:hypothetical protein